MPADQLAQPSAQPLLALADGPAKHKHKHKDKKHKDRKSKHGISKHVSKSEAKELQKQLLLAKLRCARTGLPRLLLTKLHLLACLCICSTRFETAAQGGACGQRGGRA